MTQFTLLILLLGALLTFRLAHPTCRWLYKRWRQIVEMRRLQEWNKRPWWNPDGRYEPVAAWQAGSGWILGTLEIPPVKFGGWQWASGTGEIAE